MTKAEIKKIVSIYNTMNAVKSINKRFQKKCKDSGYTMKLNELNGDLFAEVYISDECFNEIASIIIKDCVNELKFSKMVRREEIKLIDQTLKDINHE